MVLLVGVSLIVVIIAGVLAFAPLTPFDMDFKREVGSAGSSDDLTLNVDVEVCEVEIVFSDTAGPAVTVDLDLDGRRGLLVGEPSIDLTVEHETVGDALAVDVILDMPTDPTMHYDDPRMVITVASSANVTLNVVTDVGDVRMDVPSSVRLEGVSLYAKVGSVEVNLNEGAQVLGDLDLHSNVGSVRLDCKEMVLSDGVDVHLSTSTGSLYLEMVQTVSPGGNATFNCETGTGSVHVDLTIGGSTAAEITSQAGVGDIDTELTGFSGMDVHLVSDNHPDVFNLDLFLETGVGSIDIVAEWSG